MEECKKRIKMLQIYNLDKKIYKTLYTHLTYTDTVCTWLIGAQANRKTHVVSYISFKYIEISPLNIIAQ